jgi:hypothetical protein
MVKYLKEAFWASPHMPGLEHVPVNALAVAAFGIFEFAESWIWLVGLGLETAYLYACFTSDLQRLEAKWSWRSKTRGWAGEPRLSQPRST